MRRSTFLPAVASVLILGACSRGEVRVVTSIEVTGAEGTETRMLDDIEVHLLPYDRDPVFDSLEAAADTPEPPIPPSLMEARDSIAAAEEVWRTMDDRWNQLRDSLTTLNDVMADYSPAESRYIELFNLYGDLEGEYNSLDRGKDAAFQRFTSLQEASSAQSDSIRFLRDQWADDAFAEAVLVFDAKAEAAGREAQVDTTGTDIDVGVAGAPGTAVFTGLKAGTWWVHARYEEVYTELYWNIPVEVEGGEPVVVELTRENAELRPIL